MTTQGKYLEQMELCNAYVENGRMKNKKVIFSQMNIRDVCNHALCIAESTKKFNKKSECLKCELFAACNGKLCLFKEIRNSLNLAIENTNTKKRGRKKRLGTATIEQLCEIAKVWDCEACVYDKACEHLAHDAGLGFCDIVGTLRDKKLETPLYLSKIELVGPVAKSKPKPPSKRLLLLDGV